MGREDVVQRAEDLTRNSAAETIIRHARPDQEPLTIDGKRHCVDCRQEIPAERLEAKPDAIRCCPCQKGHDAKHPK